MSARARAPYKILREGDFILWTAASNYLGQFLEFLHNILFGSWGWAIVALTVIFRLVTHPLNAKQMRSMQQMQRLQPRLKVLQEKYADDREALSRETMALYREHKVNPASGCLPLLIQLPVLILLFNVLRASAAKFGEQTFFGVPLAGTVLSALAKAVGHEGASNPLIGVGEAFRAVSANPAGLRHATVYLPILLLLALIVFLTWYQQKLTSSDNPQMASMGVIMPIFMGFICLSMPGGLLVYWMLSSLFAVLQQMYTVRKVAKEEKPVLYAERPREGETAKKAVYAPKRKGGSAAPRKGDGADIPAAGQKQSSFVYDDDSFIPRRSK